MSLNKRIFLKGAADTFPLILAAIPFAILFGALAIKYGMSVFSAIGMSVFVFAGASQFIAVTLLGAGAPIIIIVLTVFVVNLRHSLYSISMMPFVKSLKKWQRITMGFWMTDESFAAVSAYLNSKPTDEQLHWYYWGSAIAMYSSWVLFSVVGALLGTLVPNMTNWGLDMAMVLAFIAIVVPMLKHKSHIACAFTAIVAAALTYDWPYKTGLLVSCLLAIAVGVLLEKSNKQGSQG